eukprot:Selendium_serpulae@DN2157_c0_g1_i1.p2
MYRMHDGMHKLFTHTFFFPHLGLNFRNQKGSLLGKTQNGNGETESEELAEDPLFLDTGSSGFHFSPRIDISEDDNSMVIVADLPGMKKEELSIQIEPGGFLRIFGERKKEHATMTEQCPDQQPFFDRTSAKLQERCFGRFERRIALPAHTLLHEISASCKEGVLRITIPRSPEAAPTVVAID